MNAAVRGRYGSTWYTAGGAGTLDRPQLTFDLDVDVCVIGAGLAGLTVAREVARRGWSVAVLEAKRIAWNASGRNCGFVLPGFAAGIDQIVERVGLTHAKALWKLSEAGVEYVRATIRDTGMPGAEATNGWLDVSKVDNSDELLALVTLLGQEFGADIEGWPTERVRDALRCDFYFHAIHFPRAFHINPLAYALGLANAALAAGARIFEETPALAIDPAGVRKRIVTPKARVRAAHVVLAGNAHLGLLIPRLAKTVLPVASYVAVTEPLGDRLARAITYKGAVSDTRFADYHYRIVGGDRLMWAGRISTWPRSADRIAGSLKNAINRTYPQLGHVEIAHAWYGVMGFSVHRMPQIGEVSPALWLASAFGGHGINTTAMAGELIARAIVEGDDRWRLFLPYELVWAGGILGRAVTQLRYWSRRTGEDIAASLSRRREAVWRADEALSATVEGVQPEAAEISPAAPRSPISAVEADRLSSAALVVEAEPANPAVTPAAASAEAPKGTGSASNRARKRKSRQDQRGRTKPDNSSPLANAADEPAATAAETILPREAAPLRGQAGGSNPQSPVRARTRGSADELS